MMVIRRGGVIAAPFSIKVKDYKNVGANGVRPERELISRRQKDIQGMAIEMRL
jgi:hypothetical protein